MALGSGQLASSRGIVSVALDRVCVREAGTAASEYIRGASGRAIMTTFTFPPTSVLVAQIAAALSWIAAYMIWARVFYAVIDPMLRRRLGAWVNADVIWLYRRGSLYASPSSFRLRRSTWSWGLGADRENAPLRDGIVYVAYVICVPVIAGLWLIALLSYFALWRHALSAVVVLPLFFLIIPLYMRYWSGQHSAPGAVGQPGTGLSNSMH